MVGEGAAVLILLFFEARYLRFTMGALMVFGLPIADMLMTLVRRWRNGRPLMEGDRSHFYDQLIDRGLSVRRVVMISYLLTVVFVAMGCLAIFLRGRYLVPVYVLFVLCVMLAVGKLKMVRLEQPTISATADRPETR